MWLQSQVGEQRDEHTEKHIERTTAFLPILAENCADRGITNRDNRFFYRSYLRNVFPDDVGKIGIPVKIVKRAN